MPIDLRQWKNPASALVLLLLGFGLACAAFFLITLVRSSLGRDAKVFDTVNRKIDRVFGR